MKVVYLIKVTHFRLLSGFFLYLTYNKCSISETEYLVEIVYQYNKIGPFDLFIIDYNRFSGVLQETYWTVNQSHTINSNFYFVITNFLKIWQGLDGWYPVNLLSSKHGLRQFTTYWYLQSAGVDKTWISRILSQQLENVHLFHYSMR